MPDHSVIVWLDDPQARQPSLVGGKAAALSRFVGVYNVPLSFCVSVPLTTEEKRSSANLPEGLQADLAAAYERLCKRCGAEDLPVAVRSSAAEEDGPRVSFAGQHKTFLNVRGFGAITEAVVRCIASASSPQARHYSTQHGLERPHERFAVLVQQLIEADASAVAFSVNPVTGAREVVINAAWGLGEGVVSGFVTPDTFIVSEHGRRIVSRQIASKETMTVSARKGTKQTAVPAELRLEPSLSDKYVLEIAELCVGLEAAFGHPVDVECCYSSGVFFLLQCRPVTTLR